MGYTYLFIAGAMLAASVFAILAFYWAAKHGHLQDVEKGAKIIFDEGEPVGKPTDSFPGYVTGSTTKAKAPR
jgi:nitrogen fixation-related uncharacterized protein